MLLLTDDSVISAVDNARFERFASRVESLVRSYLLDRGSDSVRLSQTKEEEGRSSGTWSARNKRDDMVAKARDQTRMIIAGVVNTSLKVILF